jgi:hypothetical protein
MVQAVLITNQRVGDAAQIQESIPIRIVARYPGDLNGQNQSNLAKGNFRGHCRESTALDYTGSGLSKIFIYDLYMLLGPTQTNCPVNQLILSIGRLTVAFNLGGC